MSADELTTRIQDADFENELYVEPCLVGASLTIVAVEAETSIYGDKAEISITLDERGMRQLRLAITNLERERKEARNG